jgi:hypothetical protein
VYGIHPYPAMIHYRVARKIISDFSRAGDMVLDPFVGSGVTAVENMVADRRFVGYDINPLAILISRVRCTPIEEGRLTRHLNEILRKQSEVASKIDIPDFHNIRFWFKDEVIKSLAALRSQITAITDDKLRDFFLVCFSETVRKVSNTRNDEFKLVRRKDADQFVSNPQEVFRAVGNRNISLLCQFYKRSNNDHPTPRLSEKDVSIPLDLPDDSIDLVLTSPPYGDSRTTVAYGQFSRLSLRWLGLEEKVDRTSLGSRGKDIIQGLPSSLLYQTLTQLAGENHKRAEEVFGFYSDYFHSIRNIAAKVRRRGFVCFVVGNRRVCGKELPTDRITADFFSDCGFEHLTTLVREISNKRMPAKNSPSNVCGEKEVTMAHEYIVILKKAKRGN